MQKKPSSIAARKAKGRRLASEIKEKLLQFRPDLPPRDISITPSGCTGPDLTLSDRAQKEFPFTFEAKNQESIQIWQALKQAQSHAKEGLTPLLVFRRNNSEAFVALKFDDFIKLVL